MELIYGESDELSIFLLLGEIVIQVNSILETTANTQQREKYQKTLDEKKREKRTVKGKSALL